MARILLINPDYFDEIFSKSKVRAAISRGTTPLGLLSIAAPLLSAGHQVKIFDLNLINDDSNYLIRAIQEFKPDFVGITSTTPIIKKAYRLAAAIKKIDDGIIIVAGGPHPSAVPEDVLKESEIDCVVTGEGDLIFKMIVEDGVSPSIPNICYKSNGKIIKSENQGHYIKDLDALPFPAYELLDIRKYYQPRIASRNEPLGYLETSRGCYAKCIFCNKNIHGFRVRQKTPVRVVDEMERMLNIGFREIHIIDDIFTANMKRAYSICEEILRRGLKFPWYPRGGIRVDRVNLELFEDNEKSRLLPNTFWYRNG